VSVSASLLSSFTTALSGIALLSLYCVQCISNALEALIRFPASKGHPIEKGRDFGQLFICILQRKLHTQNMENLQQLFLWTKCLLTILFYCCHSSLFVTILFINHILNNRVRLIVQKLHCLYLGSGSKMCFYSIWDRTLGHSLSNHSILFSLHNERIWRQLTVFTVLLLQPRA
jgi:hypothetical protein